MVLVSLSYLQISWRKGFPNSLAVLLGHFAKTPLASCMRGAQEDRYVVMTLPIHPPFPFSSQGLEERGQCMLVLLCCKQVLEGTQG